MHFTTFHFLKDEYWGWFLLTPHTLQKLAKSEEEDVVGTYFKPARATRLMAQAQETQKGNWFFQTFYYLLQGTTTVALFRRIKFYICLLSKKLRLKVSGGVSVSLRETQRSRVIEWMGFKSSICFETELFSVFTFLFTLHLDLHLYYFELCNSVAYKWIFLCHKQQLKNSWWLGCCYLTVLPNRIENVRRASILISRLWDLITLGHSLTRWQNKACMHWSR